MEYIFTIPGPPQGKARAKKGSNGFYTPAKTVAYEKAVGWNARKAIRAPLEGPVSVSVLATFRPAKSWSKKRTGEAMGTYHTQKPDGDNILKAVCDGMQGIAFRDDSQVAEKHVRKVWGPQAQVVVSVRQSGAQPVSDVAEIPLVGVIG